MEAALCVSEFPLADGMDMDTTCAEDTVAPPTSPREVEVRWLMSGDLAATISVRPNMSLLDLKTELSGLIGVPTCDQRLFVNDQEVLGATISPCDVGATLRILRCTIDPCETNLGHFRVPLSFDRLPMGQFTQVKKLAPGINGDIYAYRWARNDAEETVAVKKLQNRFLERINRSTEFCEKTVHFNCRNNAPDPEDALAEIGVLMHLASLPDLPLYLMKAQAVFAENQFTWLVTEFADGGELFDVAASAQPPSEPQVKQYMWQLLQAIEYLHRHHIGHRDVSLENVLLKDGIVRVMDFGMAVQSHSPSGKPLRYFRSVGKDFYRAPECYVPLSSQARVVPRAGDNGGDVALLRVNGNYLCEVRLPADAQPHKSCLAEVYGYAATPADVFAAGVCLFILCFQAPCWTQAVVSDSAFSYVFQRGDARDGLTDLARTWNKRLPCSEAMQLMGDMMQPEPSRRLSAAQCLAHPWFAELATTPVLIHAA